VYLVAMAKIREGSDAAIVVDRVNILNETI
jgi:hypothetical protein